MERMTVAEAAKVLNINPQAIRLMIKAGVVDFGVVLTNGTRSAYYIFKDRFYRYLKGELK